MINIEEIFKKAADIVKELPENLQEKAFELAVLQLSSPSPEVDQKIKEQLLPQENITFFEKLERETGVDIEYLKTFYKLDNKGGIKVVTPLNGKVSQQQRLLAYLYIFGVKFGLGRDWISSIEFARQVGNYKINDGHTNVNLGRDRNNIRQSGKKKGKEYALTPNGVLKAKDILKGVTK